MRVNIRQILAVPLALAVAWMISARFAGNSRPLTRASFEAYMGVRSIGDWIQMELHHDGPKYDAGTLSRWLEGQLLPDDPSELKSGLSFKPDPWGNSYRVIELQDSPSGGLGIYSCGRDGVSNSDGSDEDDIQSWFSERTATAFYKREADRKLAAQRLNAALIIAPFAYLPLFFVLRTRRRRTTEPSDPPESSS